MKSRIYEGHVMHARLAPERHVFRYPVYFFALDLDELPKLGLRLFGYNTHRPWTLRDADYLRKEPGAIREKLLSLLQEKGCGDGIARIELVTSARLFGYAFNPVSFYFCHGPDDSLRAVVAEVNNTFGERHFYVLDRPETGADGFARAQAGKKFHVSPFNNVKGDYDFAFSVKDGRIDLRVNLLRDGQTIINTQWLGQARPLTDMNLLRTGARHPLATLLTVPRITWQAAKLYWGRKLAFHPKPIPESPMTIQTAKPSLGQRIAMRLVLPYLDKLRKGHLTLVLPDGTQRTYGTPGSQPAIVFRVKDYRFFVRALRDSEIGFGESYMAGEWETDDLPGLIQLFIENRDVFHDDDIGSARIGRLLNRLLHTRRKNTLTGSRKNIASHYDLSNDLFRLFLDPTMMYSCALYSSPGESLEDAQRNKLHALIRKASIQPDDHVLEIGSGWGQFAIEAVRQTGCRVTTITVSQQQHDLARQRIREAGLSDRIEVELRDYRLIEGRFDKIVSIEMLEAVGHEYLGTFFSICDRVLKPGGVMALQVISMPDNRYETYREGVDWIQKHIFPGGHLPSLDAMKDAMSHNSKLAVQNFEDIGLHYVQTLRAWRERFMARQEEVRAMGFDDEFIRKWQYYFAYCEAAFASKALHDFHLVLARPQHT